MPRNARVLPLLLLSGMVAYAAASEPVAGAGSVAAGEGMELFEQAIRPVLIEHCYECHSDHSDELQAGLLVDHRQGLIDGGDSGAAIVPGRPDESLLLQALRYEDLQMPPNQKLPAEVIGQFVRWIELGAPDPRDASGSPASEPAAAIDWAEARRFWAFQPPTASPLPSVEHRQWPHRRHDYFVLAAMEPRGLEPNPPASSRNWLRRISLDLVGLPPSDTLLAELPSINGARDEQRIVDQLIASPHFGERWARLWLDLARYAEDQAHIVGEDKSLFYPNAYRYRDWVISAFNQAVPYDEFLRLQLAADLCGASEQDRVALGFLGLGPKYYDRRRLEVQAEEWEDRVDTVCRSLLGLTVACARCHDHKYDPIPTSDYYSLASVFASTEMFNRPLDGAEVRERSGQAKDPEQSLHVVRDGEPLDLTVFIRGNVQSPGAPTHRGFLTVLSPDAPERFESGSGRLELAETITRRENPLTARVFVNRVWGQLIGEPLVATPSNFGALGELPSHPELLDDLAVRFMESSWSVKWLIREIVTSATYRQSSMSSPRQHQIDPSNRWLSRMHRKRLSVEAWRDSLLSVAGRLENTLGGPSMDPDDPRSTRRTVYAAVSRFELNPMLNLYDFPDANIHAARRATTTTPLQKLFVLNHPFMIHQAEAVVERLGEHCSNDQDGAITTLYLRLFAREPSAKERQLAREFATSAEAWVEYAHALLASNELLFVD
jgi:hypothetical protein